jgi:hypothetical protein
MRNVILPLHCEGEEPCSVRGMHKKAHAPALEGGSAARHSTAWPMTHPSEMQSLSAERTRATFSSRQVAKPAHRRDLCAVQAPASKCARSVSAWAEGRWQRAEGRGQRAEGRGQRAEGRGQRAEGRGQRAEGRGQSSCGWGAQWRE